jgi:CRISPR-associated protein Cas2
MCVVIAYDISEDSRRSRLVRLLEGYGERVQYSVFECDLGERHYARLLKEVTRFMEPEDRIRLYRMPRADEDHVVVLGGNPVVRAPPYIIV